MSVLGGALAGLRRILLLEHRVDTLAGEAERLSAGQTETRERVIRLEIIIDEARRAARERQGRSAEPRIEP